MEVYRIAVLPALLLALDVRFYEVETAYTRARLFPQTPVSPICLVLASKINRPGAPCVEYQAGAIWIALCCDAFVEY
jgi:hypothetical protein